MSNSQQASGPVDGDVVGNCHKHPHAMAVDQCPACRALTCEYCLTPLGDTFLCLECARSRRLRKRILAGAVVVVVLGVIGVVGWLAAGAMKVADTGTIAKGQRKGRLTDEQALGLEFAQAPCSKKHAKAWVTQEPQGDCDKVLSRAQFYFDRCGPYLRLRWATYGCYKRRQQYDRAITEVSRLIREWPYDKDFRWWRAELYARKKAWPQALNDYWQSIVLSPAMRLVPFDLQKQAERAGQKCRAVYPMLQHAFYHQAWELDAEERRTRLAAMQACPETLGTGDASGFLAAGSGAPPLPVRINGKATGDFALDLETGLTMISRDYADRLGLGRGTPFIAWYGEQLQSGHFVILKEVAWGDARAKQVEALILKNPPFFTDGVLGRTFLIRFKGSYNRDRTEFGLKPLVFPVPTPDPDPDSDL